MLSNAHLDNHKHIFMLPDNCDTNHITHKLVCECQASCKCMQRAQWLEEQDGCMIRNVRTSNVSWNQGAAAGMEQNCDLALFPLRPPWGIRISIITNLNFYAVKTFNVNTARKTS